MQIIPTKLTEPRTLFVLCLPCPLSMPTSTSNFFRTLSARSPTRGTLTCHSSPQTGREDTSIEDGEAVVMSVAGVRGGGVIGGVKLIDPEGGCEEGQVVDLTVAGKILRAVAAVGMEKAEGERERGDTVRERGEALCVEDLARMACICWPVCACACVRAHSRAHECTRAKQSERARQTDRERLLPRVEETCARTHTHSHTHIHTHSCGVALVSCATRERDFKFGRRSRLLSRDRRRWGWRGGGGVE
jgi:hypothetical protein